MAKKTKKEGVNKKESNHMLNLPHDHLKFGQKAADFVTGFCGSWKFIFLISMFVAVWIILNILMVIYKWDPYPFIILNLSLSCIAVIEASIILMSQNRTSQRDRLQARYDYLINRKAEKEIASMQKDLAEIKALIKRKKYK